jgi:hypothetical protein
MPLVPLPAAVGTRRGPARADVTAVPAPPTTTAVDDTKTFAAGSVCPFPIVRHMYGIEAEKVHTLQDGTLRDRFYVQDYTYALTNPATGESASSKEGGQFTVFEYADGTVQIVITGNDALFTAPHTGFIAAQNGRYVETDYPDGSASLDVDTGHFDTGFDSALCAALS